MAKAAHDGCPPDSDCEDEYRNIYDAIKKGDEKAVKSFLKPNGNIDVDEKYVGDALLHIAIKENRKNIVELLLKSGADINALNDKENTPLHIAIKKGNKDIIELLLEKKWKIGEDNRKKALDLVNNKPSSNSNSFWQSIKALLEPSRPSVSEVRRPSDNTDSGSDNNTYKIDRKRKPSDDTANGPSSPKRPTPDYKPADSSPTQASTIKQSSSKPHKDTAVGLETSMHGNIFQLKLQMLVLKRGIDHYDYFRLYTELPGAEKFDDVVWGYKKSAQDKKLTWVFLQAKHKLRPDEEKIKLSDLESKDNKNPFGLHKYLESFCKIKKNGQFQEDNLEYFIICTNADFEEGLKSYFIEDQEEEKILDLRKGEKNYKLNENQKIKKILTPSRMLTRSSKDKPKDSNNESNDNVKEFIEKFRFVVNYPSEDLLGDLVRDEIIAKDLSLEGKINLIKARLLYDTSQRSIMDWFKSSETRCLLWEHKHLYEVPKRDSAPHAAITPQEDWKVKEPYAKLCKEINSLVSFGFTKFRIAKLRESGINFKGEESHLKKFLSSENEGKQIFHLITQGKETTLSAIRVLRTLEGSTYKEDGDYIFMLLSDLLTKEIQKFVIKSVFSLSSVPDLLVIECQENQDKVDDLYKKLSHVLNKDKKKKIILIAQREDILTGKFKGSDKYESKNDQSDFKDLDLGSQDKILEKEVNFQGKDISLNEIIDMGSARKNFDRTDLSTLLDEEKIQVGNTDAFSSIGYVPDYYIERKFQRQKIKTEVLKEKAISELFFITEAKKKNLTKLGVKKGDIHGWKDTRTYDKGIILPALGQNYKGIFQDFAENIHWLEYRDGNLFWKASKGDLSVLNNYIDKSYVPDEKNTLKEEDFSKPGDLKQKVVIVANDPGVGKSTVLTGIAHKMKRSSDDLWVVRINLNDFAEKGKETSLEKIEFKENDINAAIDFVSEMAVPGDPKDTHIQFERKLFKAGFVKIVILFDGFDEISPSYKANTTKLIKALKVSKVTQFWVTTRVHENTHLEKELDSLAYTLNPLTEKEQVVFLSKFWKWGLKFFKDPYNQEIREKNHQEIRKHLEELQQGVKKLLESTSDSSYRTAIQDLNERIFEICQPYQQEQTTQKLESLQEDVHKLDLSAYAKVLLRGWSKSISDTNKEFAFVPLNLKMLAEVVFEKKFQSPEDFRLFDLYDKFIEIKFDIFYREKNKISKGNVGADSMVASQSADLRKVHHELALKFFFPEEKSLPVSFELDRFRDKFTNENKNPNQELARVGLLTLKGGQLDFIHRSFAEYFLSEYLVKNLQNEQVQKLLMEKILLENDYALIRKFFNAQLEKDPLPSIVLTDVAKKSIEESLKEDSLRFGYYAHKNTTLYVATSNGHRATVQFLLDIMQGNLDKEFLKKIFLATEISGRNVLATAIEGGHHETVLTLLKFVRDNLKEILKDLLLNTAEDTALYFAVKSRQFETLRVLLDWMKKNLGKDTFEEIMSPSVGRDTFLYVAVSFGQTDIVQLILDELKGNDNKEFLKKILFKNDSFHVCTVLFLAAEYGYHEIFRAFLDLVRKNLGEDALKEIVLKCDPQGETILHLTGSSDKPFRKKILENLYESLKDHPDILRWMTLAKDFKGHTTLQKASLENNHETVTVLLKNLKDHPDILKEMVLVTDKEGKTALDRAEEKDYHETVTAFLNGLEGYPVILQALRTRGEQIQTAFHKAVEWSNNKSVNSLLEWIKTNNPDLLKKLVLATDKEIDLHTERVWSNNKSVDSLFKLIKENDPDLIKKLVLTSDEFGQNPLHSAIANGNIEIFRALLDNIEDNPNLFKELVLATDKIGQTVLHYYHNIAIIQTLLNSIKDNPEKLVLATNQYGQTALHKAVDNGSIEIIQTLLDGIKDNPEVLKKLMLTTDILRGETALHRATYCCHTEILSALLNSIKDNPEWFKELVLATDEFGRTALHVAVHKGSIEIVQTLLDSIKDNPNLFKELVLATNKFGHTALHVAASKGSVEIIQTLLDSIKDNPETLKKLVLNCDKRERTALNSTFSYVKGEVINSLLDWVKDNLRKDTLKELIFKTNRFGKTALHIEAAWNNHKSIKALLDWVKKNHPSSLKDFVFTTDKYGRTALHEAARLDCNESVKSLLHWVKENYPDLLKELVQATDPYRKTALDLAAEKGYTKIFDHSTMR